MEANLDVFFAPLIFFLYRDPAGHRADPSPIPLRRRIVRLTNDRVFCSHRGTYGRMVSHFFGTRTCFWLVFRPPLLSTRSFSLSLLRCPALGLRRRELAPGPNLYLRRNYAVPFPLRLRFCCGLLTLAGLMLHPGILTADGGKPMPNPWLVATAANPCPIHGLELRLSKQSERRGEMLCIFP